MRKLLSCVVLAGLLVGCAGPESVGANSSLASKAEGQEIAQKMLNDLITENRQWKYFNTVDEMRGYRVSVVSKLSENSVTLRPPYDEAGMIISIRTEEDGLGDVTMSLTDGQFFCGATDCIVNVKFDDGKIIAYEVELPDSGEIDKYFFKYKGSDEDFVLELKKSKKLIIEASLYQKGSSQFVFDLSGLDTSKL